MFDTLFQYYGLDWATLAFGLIGCYLTSNRRREGFLFSILGCMCGFSVATMSGQYGFIVYNVILIFMMARGYTGWRKQERAYALGAE